MKENSVNVWDAFLKTLENRGVSSSGEVASDVQEELINYSIPAPFLIDREGKVISVKARGNLLSELVEAEIAGKKN